MFNEESKEQNRVCSMLPDLLTPVYMLLYNRTLEEYTSLGSCHWGGQLEEERLQCAPFFSI